MPELIHRDYGSKPINVGIQKTAARKVDVSVPLPRLSVVEYSHSPRENYRFHESVERVNELASDLEGKVSCVTALTYVRDLDDLHVIDKLGEIENILEWLVLGESHFIPDYEFLSSRPDRFGAGGTEIYVGIKSPEDAKDHERLGETGYALAQKMGIGTSKIIEKYDKLNVVDIVRHHTRRVL